mmetsp:Transcript_17144/g.28329  ORF Transcript_17144/g.28329 Transcript_17144/m.28329 type:complete len:109 (+) Transcript_17144:452-778(+)
MEDMKYFKLELLNREQNYNKVFGRQPTVGVMDVLKTAIPKPPGAASTSAMADEKSSKLPPLGSNGSGNNSESGKRTARTKNSDSRDNLANSSSSRPGSRRPSLSPPNA